MQFREGMSTQRSNTVTRIRRICAADIFELKNAELLTTASRSQFRQRIGWIPPKGSSQPGHYDPWNVEVLHSNYLGRFNKDTVFLSPVLLCVCISANPPLPSYFLSNP
jgi:hypothetical protein